MGFNPSDKQAAFCNYLGSSERGLHVLGQGAQGGGKSSCVIRGWATWLSVDCPPGQKHICTYADERQGKWELGEMLREWSEETGLKVDLKAQVWLTESLQGEWQKVLPMPYGKALADPKFLNWNLASIFVDEAVNMPQGTRKNLISRLRAIENPLAVWCYNPVDNNNFKKEVHDPVERGDMTGRIFVFKLTDNPALPPGYREMQEFNYPSGADRTRMIEGEWAANPSQVYADRFTEWTEINTKGRIRPKPEGDPLWWAAGVDPDDGSGTTAAILFGRWPYVTPEQPGGVWACEEWGNVQADNKMDGIEKSLEIVKQFTTDRSVASWVIDAAGGDMIPEIAKMAQGTVLTSGRPPLSVVDSIKHVQRFFNNGWLWIDPKCTETIAEGSDYRNPEDGNKYGDVKPVKANDHYMDALRYLLSKTAPLSQPVQTPMVPAPAYRRAA